MSKITGIGGVFLQLNQETKRLLKWYHEVLEVDVTEYGINFLEQNNGALITFSSGQNDAILNFTVEGIEDFLVKLKEKSVEFVMPLKDYGYGKFCQIKDVNGNVIELCELNKAVYDKMVLEEIKTYKQLLEVPMEERICESCGMKMKTAEDCGGGLIDNKYCAKCCDEEGNLFPFDKKLELLTMFIMGRQGVPQMMASNMAKQQMAKMPAWKSHFE